MRKINPCPPPKNKTKIVQNFPPFPLVPQPRKNINIRHPRTVQCYALTLALSFNAFHPQARKKEKHIKCSPPGNSFSYDVLISLFLEQHRRGQNANTGKKKRSILHRVITNTSVVTSNLLRGPRYLPTSPFYRPTGTCMSSHPSTRARNIRCHSIPSNDGP